MKYLLSILIVITTIVASAQVFQHFDALQVGSKDPLTPGSVFDVKSTTKGALIPRMTTTQRNAISSPSDGLLVYDITLHTLMEYNSGVSGWVTPGMSSALLANKALKTDSSGLISTSATTATELGYLSGSGVTSGGILYGNASAFRISSAGTSGQVLLSGGTGSPTWSTNISGNSGNVTGTVTIANGGTGQTTANAGFNALSPMTTGGDLIYGGASGIGTRLANGSSGQVIQANGGTSAPSWTTNISGNAANVTGTVAILNGGTGQTTKSAAFDALSPMSASGDVTYGGASGTGTRLAKGSDGQVLTLASGLPSWAPATGGVSTVGTIDSQSKSANGLVISGANIYAQTADGTYPGLMSTGTQTIAGTKTFSSTITGTASGNTTYIASNHGVVLSGSGNTMTVIAPDSSTTKVLTSGGASADPSWQQSGGGTGVNFVGLGSTWVLTSPDDINAESTVGAWAAYADAAGTVPVDMTGGSPTVTIARTTTAGHILDGLASFEIVKDAANRQGNGVSLLVNVPPGYRGKSVQLKATLGVVSGTYASGDVVIAAFDLDDAILVSVSNNSVTGSSLVNANLVIPSTCSQLRIGFHVASTSASAYTIDFDDVILGPPTDTGTTSVVSAWKNDLTFTTNGFGTISNQNFWYKQVGDTMEVQGYFTLGTLAASTAYIQLPSGITMDTSKMGAGTNTTLVGRLVEVRATDSVVTDNPSTTGIYIFYDGSTNNQLFLSRRVNGVQFVKQNGNDWANAASDNVAFSFKVPITQWSSATTGFNAAQLANVWQGYHDGGCSFPRASATVGDPTADSSGCSLVETLNQNAGTVVSYKSGSDYLPGIVYPTDVGSTYYVCATISGENTTTAQGASIRLIDQGSTVINGIGYQTGASGENGKNWIRCGYYKAVATSSTFRIQTAVGSGTFTITNEAIDGTAMAIAWSVSKYSGTGPAPFVTNTVVTPAQAVTEVVGATVSSAGTVTETTGDWINGNCSKSTSVYTCTLNANIFSSAPACSVTPVAGGLVEADLDTVSTSQIIVRTFNVSLLPADEPFHLLCVGQH